MSIAKEDRFYGARFIDLDALIGGFHPDIAKEILGALDEATLETIRFTRVSTVLNLMAKGGLVGWAFNLGINGMQDLAKKGHSLSDLELAQLQALLKDFGWSPHITRDKAADRGTRAHKIAEKLGRGLSLETAQALAEALPEDERGYGRAACRYFEEVKPVVLATEKLLYSLENRYCGTTDSIELEQLPVGEIECIVDYKTSKNVYDSHGVQLAAYELARAEMTGDGSFRSNKVVLFRPDGTFKQVYTDVDPSAFLGLLAAFRALKQKEE